MVSDCYTVADLALPARARNALFNAGITTLAQLAAQPASRLLLLRCFGEGSLRDVEAALGALGLKLAAEPPPRPP